MQNQNTIKTCNDDIRIHNKNAEINHNKHLHLSTTEIQDNFNQSLAPYTNIDSIVNINYKTSKKINRSKESGDMEKNVFELSRKDKKGFTTDAGGGNISAMGGSTHGIQINHRTS